ncbi:hypothetical protein ABZX51_006773 [Aspergillus tubingensis]|uniref:CENP-V/GFA domain-containing protein n=3 Tax=Aspergillus subgen. Circumdati TaxID=2720871 RepID=A0A1L9NHB1_ASPTC|nr:hypothetical protein BO79DRAFT_252965 [Aspergillus costaricaensis CBS 115574]OJI88524.1 hypothetical protein ASPTUDRAFT_50449 [Aspergillus tubingensis CBS 134.48]RAK90782.1 hypothetical protein BO79DRAFT_252965 [Aspergillus costaricaensis CBS 115574]GLB05935.1 hypothetical protein AtubIFM57258_001229 [Aspergillus tubingensis]
MVVKGSCNCGRIRVTMDNPTPSGGGVMICYCLNCRKQSGAAGTYVVVVENKDMVLTGSPKKFLDTNTACGRPLDRYFCYNCGCPIMYRSETVLPGKSLLMFGLFEDIPKPVAEVWTKRRPEWISATSEVLQYVTDIPDDVSGEEAKKLGW